MTGARLIEHFDRVSQAPGAVARLRRFMLELAVRGKLVAQDPSDDPAREVLRTLGVDDTIEGPFTLPSWWAWTSVGSVGDARLGKMLDKAKNKGTLRPYLRNVNVRWFDFDLSDVFEMRFEDDEIDEFALRAGDVLICEGGEPGRCAVWDERAERIYFQKAIHRVRFSQGVDPDFFALAVRESFDSGLLASHYTGITIKHLTGRGLDSVLFPLPPIAEQHRIVAKVGELMAVCDQLEAQLTAGAAINTRLLESLLHEALAHPHAGPTI